MGSQLRAWAGAALLLFAAVGATAAEPKRVLFLHSFGQNFQPWATFAAYLRTDLAERSPEPLDLYEVSLEIARFTEGQQESPFIDYLLALVAERPPDLVVPIGGSAVRFAQRHRQQLFSSTPMLFAGVEERLLQDPALTRNDAVVPATLDVPGLIQNILQVLPKTTTVVVVIGNSPLEKFWVEELHQELAPFSKQINFVYLNQLPFEDMLKRVAALPPQSAILYGDVAVDAHGVPRREEQTLARIRGAANGPIFGLFDYELGHGIVGGSLISVRGLSQQTADVGVRILHGEVPGDIKTRALRAGVPEYDWRELQRWGISEANLPPDSRVRFREPTVWDRYKGYIVVAASVCTIEAVLILALLVNRGRLRRARNELQATEQRMSLAALAANLRFWVWEISRNEVWATKSDWSDYTWSPSEPMTLERFIEVVHPDDRASMRQAVEQALAGNGEYRAEYRVVVPDSMTRWIAGRGRVEFDQNGKPRRLLAVSIDVTERRLAEEAARDLTGRLINAQEDERARLARALHDDVTQRLALLAIEAGRKEGALDGATGGEAMRTMRDNLVRVSEDVHALAYALHPAILEDLGLVEALRAECDRFSALESSPVYL